MSESYEIPVVSIRLVRDSGVLTEKKVIRSPLDVADLLMERMKDLDREVFVVVHLSTRNDVLSILSMENAFIGTLNENHVRVADLFKGAILANAMSIIVAHNHPSGDPTPSPEDVAVTNTIREAGELLGIELLDHIVVGENRFLSIREMGLGGFK
jgi:DNA repair protein RadC